MTLIKQLLKYSKIKYSNTKRVSQLEYLGEIIHDSVVESVFCKWNVL